MPAMYLVLGILSLLAGASFLTLQQWHGLGCTLGDVSNLVWHTHGNHH